MAQSPATRACQHLLLQGFTLYTEEAATAMRAMGSSSLDDPQHLSAVFLPGKMVQCSWGGQRLLIPCEAEHVRDARLKLETAVTLQIAPPTQALDAYPDDLLRREIKRRRLAQEPE